MPQSTRSTTNTPRAIDRLDVHVHFIPPFYAEALVAAGHIRPDGMPAIPKWSETDALRTMDELGIRTAILSISSPGVHFGDDAQAKALARRINEEGARIKKAHPGRFGHFASVPLPDMPSAIEEAIYALDVLKADGIVVETNHDGVYLGDPCMMPFYDELNRRNAVMFIHPTSPACSCCERLDSMFPRPMMEFLFDTTRTVSDLIWSGAIDRYENMRVIVPHAGAALTGFLNRLEKFRFLMDSPSEPPPSFKAAMKKLHFDLAGVPVPHLLRELLDVADPERIHYGSDYPFTPAEVCENLMTEIENTPLLNKQMLRAMFTENAQALFPQFAEALRAAPKK